MEKTITYTRAELFEMVWRAPVLKLAREIGVSDVGLAKACRRAGIPLPNRGYWAKREKDRPKKPALPGSPSGKSERVTFRVLDPSAFEFARKAVTADVERIPIPTELRDPDVLVIATIRAAKAAKTNNGSILLSHKRVLSVRTSPAALDRAMLLLDTLIKACRQRGYAWRISPEGKTIIRCNGKDVEVYLKERISRTELPRRIREGQSHFSSYAEYGWTSTNEFTFQVENDVAGGARRSWSDGKTAKLEHKLHEIVSGLPLVVRGIQALEEERAERQRQRDSERATERERARSKEVTRQLRATLTSAVSKWERAERIRAFCFRLEGRAKATSNLAAEACAPWIAWAREQADLLDPTFGDVTDLITTDIELPEWFGGDVYGQLKPDWWTT